MELSTPSTQAHAHAQMNIGKTKKIRIICVNCIYSISLLCSVKYCITMDKESNYGASLLLYILIF